MLISLSQPFATAQIRVDVPSPVLSLLEQVAVEIGLADGRIARTRSRLSSLLVLFTRRSPKPLADTRLEALRAYAELASALFPRPVPDESLQEAGYSAQQIGHVLQVIGGASR